MHNAITIMSAIAISAGVAAVNGPAVAGGAGLVACCDAVVAAESAVIGFSGIRHGLVAPVVMGPLVRCVGPGWARYLLLTGELIDFVQARACGLFHECVADAACVERAVALARQLAELPDGAFRAAKRALRSEVNSQSQRRADGTGGEGLLQF